MVGQGPLCALKATTYSRALDNQPGFVASKPLSYEEVFARAKPCNPTLNPDPNNKPLNPYPRTRLILIPEIPKLSKSILRQLISGINHVTGLLDPNTTDFRMASVILPEDLLSTPLTPIQLSNLSQIDKFRRMLTYVARLWMELRKVSMLLPTLLGCLVRTRSFNDIVNAESPAACGSDRTGARDIRTT